MEESKKQPIGITELENIGGGVVRRDSTIPVCPKCGQPMITVHRLRGELICIDCYKKLK